MAAELPRASGVYKITCLPTGKVYVGSAVDIRARWLQHRYDLRKGEHHSRYLQQAWDKYGPEAFKVSVLELADTPRLIEVEQRWIDSTRCAERSYGFNMYALAGSPGDVLAKTWEGFIDPSGNEVRIHNLHEFCREHALSVSAMVALSRPQHKLKQHKGWTHKSSPRKREYIKTWVGFIDPAGNEVAPITNLKEFCRQHGLDATHMVAVLKGRICSHQGWTHQDGRRRQDEKTYHSFVNPQGERVTITNLTAFCRKHGLHPVRMFNLISGVRKRHKGWTWNGGPRMNPKLLDENGNPKYTNRLIHEASPYLQHHAHNPVDWHPWGEEALQLARELDKPLLISIGYRSCWWCFVQASESFEDEAVAALQNELFVNIKVDREERPDLDSVYMSAVQAMTRQGGWPLNVFCLPDGTPFYGGTYFPPDEKAARYRMSSWSQVLRSVAQAYRTRRAEIEEAGRDLVEHIGMLATAGSDESAPPLAAIVAGAVDDLAQQLDQREGGFGGAPKFPQPMALEFLLRSHLRGDSRALPMVTLTLTKMARGGMYDQLGGGFHRYSVDSHWLVPHFEKMLYDNALLARAYVEAYQVTGEPCYRRVAEETLGYMLREMASPEGAFYSTQDAASLPYPGAPHAEEGAFYVWSPDEVREHLGEDAALFCQLYDVSRAGNFEGKNILNLPRDPAEVARVTGVPPERLEQVAARGRERLYAARAKRPWPFRDEKIITAWNAMAMRALAQAGAALGGEAGARYTKAAARCAHFLLSTLRRPDGRLLRSWKDGRPGPLGFLEDYALLVDGLIALHAADGAALWLREALALADAMLDLFWDETISGLYDTAADQEALVTRPRDTGDNATPSGNSAAAEALIRLAAFTGREDYRERAEAILAGSAGMLARFPLGFGRLLCAADLAVARVSELAIVGEPAGADTRALLESALGPYRPHLVVARAAPGDDEGAALTPLLRERPALGGRATAYVCEGFVCKLPVTTPEELAAQLG